MAGKRFAWIVWVIFLLGIALLDVVLIVLWTKLEHAPNGRKLDDTEQVQLLTECLRTVRQYEPMLKPRSPEAEAVLASILFEYRSRSYR